MSFISFFQICWTCTRTRHVFCRMVTSRKISHDLCGIAKHSMTNTETPFMSSHFRGFWVTGKSQSLSSRTSSEEPRLTQLEKEDECVESSIADVKCELFTGCSQGERTLGPKEPGLTSRNVWDLKSLPHSPQMD